MRDARGGPPRPAGAAELARAWVSRSDAIATSVRAQRGPGTYAEGVRSDPERASIEADVLAANHEFYRAFSSGDQAAMDELWAKRAPVSCLHPGAPLIAGRAAVAGSWRQILAAAAGWRMTCREPRVHLVGETAWVTCLEANGSGPAHLAATNIFVLEDQRWRMVHHHAGPLSAPRPERASTGLVN